MPRDFPEHVNIIVEEIGYRTKLTPKQRRIIAECLQLSPYVQDVELSSLRGKAVD
jgi:hypothetical protein